MGNQAIHKDLEQVTDPEFDDNMLQPLINKLWTFEGLERIKYKKLSIVSASDETLQSQFPMQCTIEGYNEKNVGSANVDNFIYQSTVMAGFTSGEKKIDMLRSEGKFLNRDRHLLWLRRSLMIL